MPDGDSQCVIAVADELKLRAVAETETFDSQKQTTAISNQKHVIYKRRHVAYNRAHIISKQKHSIHKTEPCQFQTDA